jgi:hypothetical protein
MSNDSNHIIYTIKDIQLSKVDGYLSGKLSARKSMSSKSRWPKMRWSTMRWKAATIQGSEKSGDIRRPIAKAAQSIHQQKQRRASWHDRNMILDLCGCCTGAHLDCDLYVVIRNLPNISLLRSFDYSCRPGNG